MTLHERSCYCISMLTPARTSLLSHRASRIESIGTALVAARARPNNPIAAAYHSRWPTMALPSASATFAASAPAIRLSHGVAVPMIGVESGA